VTATAPSPGPLAILLVDDSEDNRAMYRDYLEWDGFRVVEATDGLEALGRATALPPAAIVMDLSLPRLDGWEAARRLKADPRTRPIPVLALTAHAFAGDAERARAAGCDGYLAKPCLPEDLARAIRGLVQAADGGDPARRTDAHDARSSPPSARRETRSTGMRPASRGGAKSMVGSQAPRRRGRSAA
jgi:CheY-like chemotaxis protein